MTSNYIREADFLQESWICKEIEGKLLTTVPFFLLTSQRTFKSSTAYDSLAYAYFSHGRKEPALEYFRKVLELDPDNRNATKMVERLQSER